MGWHITAITVKRITIKRIISPVLIMFSLKTERIKVVILCLLWSDLPLKSSQLPLVFLSGLANQILCSPAFLFTITYCPRRIIHSCPVGFRFGDVTCFVQWDSNKCDASKNLITTFTLELFFLDHSLLKVPEIRAFP